MTLTDGSSSWFALCQLMEIQFMISLLSLFSVSFQRSEKWKMIFSLLRCHCWQSPRIKNPTHTLRPFFFEKHSRQDVCTTRLDFSARKLFNASNHDCDWEPNGGKFLLSSSAVRRDQESQHSTITVSKRKNERKKWLNKTSSLSYIGEVQTGFTLFRTGAITIRSTHVSHTFGNCKQENSRVDFSRRTNKAALASEVNPTVDGWLTIAFLPLVKLNWSTNAMWIWTFRPVEMGWVESSRDDRKNWHTSSIHHCRVARNVMCVNHSVRLWIADGENAVTRLSNKIICSLPRGLFVFLPLNSFV